MVYGGAMKEPSLMSVFSTLWLHLTANTISLPATGNKKTWKKRAYKLWIREIEHSSFLPLGLCASSDLANEAKMFYKPLSGHEMESTIFFYTILATHPFSIFTPTLSHSLHSKLSLSHCGHVSRAPYFLDLVISELQWSSWMLCLFCFYFVIAFMFLTQFITYLFIYYYNCFDTCSSSHAHQFCTHRHHVMGQQVHNYMESALPASTKEGYVRKLQLLCVTNHFKVEFLLWWGRKWQTQDIPHSQKPGYSLCTAEIALSQVVAVLENIKTCLELAYQIASWNVRHENVDKSIVLLHKMGVK